MGGWVGERGAYHDHDLDHDLDHDHDHAHDQGIQLDSMKGFN